MKILMGKTSKTAKTLIVFLVAILLAACILEPEEESYLDIDEIVELKLGERKIGQPSGLEVGFEKLISDSRCPIGILCFWQGMAEIQISLKIPDKTRYYFTLDSYNHTTVDTLGLHMEFLQLDPYPIFSEEYDTLKLVVTLKISRPILEL
ncbi:MAG: hypothetical protein COT43_11060 [Candidatus Marinimicrobia bacterium CG08_land_8_20_14_0_20_45_22]|nr:MAG: hypothetical protein COT43_11060 [Candidatus Marinimicrobia bacterium CG08_land_8_20_14_0_20_45_22]